MTHEGSSDTQRESPARLDRRTLLIGGSITAVGVLGAAVTREAFRERAAVFIADNQRYDGDLVRTICDGLVATGLDPSKLRGRRVLLKPNMVEPSRGAPHMTTHPAVIRAAAESFRHWGASVTVGEAPGHVRDTDMALDESGIGTALLDDDLAFADLNYETAVWCPNKGKASPLAGFYFPQSVVQADLIVSLPKMKTHHWMGVTASLKNMYGVLPGLHYGWPKNVLHHAGIPETVFDINASLPPLISIVDGIECMEGDGPIMGTPRAMGLILVGTNPTAVDATVSRLMELDPHKITYLRLAADRLGPVAERRIDQRGCAWQSLAQPFEILDKPHLQVLRGRRGALVT
jgi:uncharacterized protein (DUF362 family)